MWSGIMLLVRLKSLKGEDIFILNHDLCIRKVRRNSKLKIHKITGIACCR